MAWPLTPIQTFVATVTRWTASFANQLQAGVNGVVAGTYSLVGVVIDGVGGVASSAVAGALKVSASVSGSGAGPTPSMVKGAFYRESAIVACAAFRNTGGVITMDWGFGVSSFAHPSTGIVNITLLLPLNGVTNGAVIATPNSTPGSAAAFECKGLVGGGGATAQVQLFDSTNTAVDSSFYVLVVGQAA